MARPLTPKLSPEMIATSALALVDRDGEFTIPALAKQLRVSASSLYNHVNGKAQIVDLMRGHAISRVQIPDGDAHWAETIRAIAVEYRNTFARHPRLIPLITAYSVSDETTIRMYNAMADAFHEAGFTPKRALEAITVVDSFVLGSALDVAAPEQVWDPGEDANENLQRAVDAGLGHPTRADEAFQYGLNLLIEGFSREAGSRPPDA